jgi:SAM-dependent methyltransferase
MRGFRSGTAATKTTEHAIDTDCSTRGHGNHARINPREGVRLLEESNEKHWPAGSARQQSATSHSRRSLGRHESAGGKTDLNTTLSWGLLYTKANADKISRRTERLGDVTIDTVFSGSVPLIYDTYLGPLIFEPFADDLAMRLPPTNQRRVLETAAGTGIVTRALLRSLSATGSMVATDLNQPMLDHAAARTSSSQITWQRADAQALPFPDNMFDAVLCQFGVMFFPDKKKAYCEARRVLKPGGLFLFSVWDKIEENEFAELVTGAVANIFPDDPPLFLARTPHGYFDEAAILGDLASAGFTDVRLETLMRRSVAASCRDPAIGYCQGTPLRNEIEARDARRLTEATEAAANKISAKFGPGPVDGKIQAHVITAMR